MTAAPPQEDTTWQERRPRVQLAVEVALSSERQRHSPWHLHSPDGCVVCMLAQDQSQGSRTARGTIQAVPQAERTHI